MIITTTTMVPGPCIAGRLGNSADDRELAIVEAIYFTEPDKALERA